MLGVVVAASSACSSVDDSARIGINAPDETQFPPVADLLGHRCGSLDCHGQSSRNLQIFGCEGMRLDPNDVPGCRSSGGKDTTPAEYDATYRSLVALEPAVMSVVVAGKGANPELLTFVRKARGSESHKGGTIFLLGDDQDDCVTSWLAGKTDTDMCTKALATSP
ncbi:MAG: hypothetical protein ABI461_01905 [Polyangiaceae bacterium]